MGIVVSAGVLLDTNHLAHAVSPASPVRQRILELRLRGVRVGTCIPVLCEVEVGIGQVADPDGYRRRLGLLLKHVHVWPLDQVTARRYGELCRDLKARGRALSQVDIMIAALALQMNLTLASTDRDFLWLPALPTENW